MAQIDKVEVLKGNSVVIFGSRGYFGAIAVYTKRGESPAMMEHELLGAITERIAGFSSFREFYAPIYTPENIDTPRPDHRTTLYWDPDIVTKQGKAELSFYTADDLGYYRILVEGITDQGRVCFGLAGFMVDSYHK